MTLKFLKLDFFSMFLEFIVNSRTPLVFFFGFVEKHQFNVLLSRFKQILDNHVFIISTSTIF
jgi:hypothetical protein